MDPKVAEFAAGFDFDLDEYQITACQSVAAGLGVLVAAPTGSGKTLVGEFAVYLALAERRKCFYTTPIKALSNQKYHDLAKKYGAENVGLLTGDISENGEAPIVVMTTEVLRNMLYAGSQTLRGLGYVVMDEVHYLADRFRGAVWEEVIISLPESVQLISLSATVSNAEEFGAWLETVRGDMALVVSEKRPVPLYQQVMAGTKIYDLFQEDQVNPQLLAISKSESRAVRDDSRRPRGRFGKGKRSRYGSGNLGGAAHREYRERHLQLVPRREKVIEKLDNLNLLPAIYFIFSRAGCDQAVQHILRSGIRLTNKRQQAEIDEILARHSWDLPAEDRAAIGFEAFAQALRNGVAAHHAGLLPVLKDCVEEAFTKGLCKVVFATETLALGINMPAKSVVLEKLVKYNGEAHVDITPGEFTQLTGRAGRRGIDVEGHAVVLWQNGMDPRSVAGLAAKRTYPLKSSFVPSYNMVVNMIARVGRARARGLLAQSFAQYQSDASVVGLVKDTQRTRQEIAEIWAAATCSHGDFAEYARLRDEVNFLEKEAAKQRRVDNRILAAEILTELRVGDVVYVPAGKMRGWAVILDPGIALNAKKRSVSDLETAPRPLVMGMEREVKRLSIVDFPQVPKAMGRIRVPRHFHPRDTAAKRALAATLRSFVAEKQLVQEKPLGQPEDIAAEISLQRLAIRNHPCHECPNREEHAVIAQRALRLEADLEKLNNRASRRTNTIAQRFDRLCGVLAALGYLNDSGQEVTPDGQLLARIYSELDLVAAECIRANLFDELSAPEFAAVISSLVFEARAEDHTLHRMPNRSCEIAQAAIREVWREIRLLERDHRIPAGRAPNIGFAEAAFDWAAGLSLFQVLADYDFSAGDFVRNVRQVIDLAGQIAAAAGPGKLQDIALECQHRMRRSVVL